LICVRRRIAVDMTPLAPGGQNGGAGLVAVSLVRHLSRLAPDWEFVLLTAGFSHAELAKLDAPNVKRLCVDGASGSEQSNRNASPAGQSGGEAAAHLTSTSRVRLLARRGLQVLPAQLRVRAKDAAWRLGTARKHAGIMDAVGADLLFCPFTVPYFWRPDTPLVAIVYDLQHVAHPEFFSKDQRLNRQQHLADACRRAQRIVCISDFVRQTLLAQEAVPPDRVVTIHLGLLHEFEQAPVSPGLIGNMRVRPGGYLLYPANFWPHKNHRSLFQALRQYRQQRPDADLKLICTGAPNEAMHALQASADDLLQPGTVVFPGYVSTGQLQVLLDACAALICPSLYEGFGLPVLEAMARGKPVLCSNVASLPEIAGEAAIYFDPTDPTDMARAIAAAMDDAGLVAARVECGRTRAGLFGDASQMARKYLALLTEVLATR
jgi:glycosyltransferase involved in cell wall biosynthesis